METILTGGSGIIKLEVPQYNTKNKTPVIGILQDDIQIRMMNNWSPNSEINTALDKLQEFQQVWGADSVVNYLPTSGMTWKGTPPIRVQVSFYLITLNKNSNIRHSAKLLAGLCALNVTGSMSTGFHGGYKLDLYDNALNLNNNIDLTNNQEDVQGTCNILVNAKTNTYIRGLLCTEFQCQPSTVSCRNGEPLYYNIGMSFTGYRAPILSDLDSMFGGN